MLHVNEDDVENNEESRNGNSSNDCELKWEAPEGGWGYMVCIGMSMLFVVVAAPSSLFGLIFGDLFEDIDDGTTGITLINGVFNAVVSFSGFFTTYLLKIFSLRQVGLTGALIFVLGSISTIFTQSIHYIIFTVGILEGIGFGMMIPIAMTTFNNYFVKKRSTLMGVSSIFIGIGFMVCPYLIKYCKDRYGLKGTLIILCGLSFHTFFAMVVMQPAEWHLVPGNRKKILNTEPSNSCGKEMILMNSKIDENENSEDDKNEMNETSRKNSIISYKSVSKFQKQASLSLIGKTRRISLNYTNLLMIQDEAELPKLDRRSSLASVGNWTGTFLANEILPSKTGSWEIFFNFFELKLLKDPHYTNMCLGVSFSFFSELTFFILLPVLLNHYNFTSAEVAFCMTIAASADLVSRIFLTSATFYYNISSRKVFYYGTVIGIILRNIFFQFQSFRDVTILVGFLGFFRCWILVPLPLVFAENCPKEQFPKSYGLFMMVSGVVTLVLSIIVGVLKDHTSDHMIPFHFLTICSLVLVVPWTIEFYYKFCQKI